MGKPDRSTLQIEHLDPRTLKANGWNTNVLGPDEEEKLEASLRRFDLFDAIKVRTLPNGDLEVIGGKHRAEAAIRIGYETVPVLNLGPLDDITAREISAVDNGRYGKDDPVKLLALIEELGEADVDLSDYMIYDQVAIDAALAYKGVDLSALGAEEDSNPELSGDDARGDASDDEPARTRTTQQTLKFQMEPTEAEAVMRRINDTITEQGIAEGSQRANAGAALLFLVLGEDAL